MREKKFTRIAAFLLCLTMLLGNAVVFASASENDDSEGSITDVTLEELRELLNAITYEEYCHLSRQFIHTEPFLELEREEMIQENKCLAPIEQRIEEISQRLKLQTLYEHFNEDLVRYIVDEIELVTNKLAICRLSNGSEYYMFLDTWSKGTKRIKEE